MGVIEKQASRSTIYIYLGISIGFLNTILFPHYLDAETKGILDAITSASFLLTSIFTLGLPLLTLRHFPKFRDSVNKNNGFLSFSYLITIIGSAIGFIFIKEIFNSKVNIEYQNTFFFSLLFFAFLFRLIFSNLDALIKMNFNAVLGVLSSNLVLKIVNLTSVILYAFNFIDIKTLFIIFVIGLSSPGIISLLYVNIKPNYGLNLSNFFKKVKSLGIKNDLIKTSIYGFFGSVGGVMVIEIDRIMLLDLMGAKEVGIYTTAALFGVIVNVPSRSIKGIAAAVISEAWKKNDINKIDNVYKKSTLNLQIISGYLLVSILVCAPYLFTIMRPEYALGINIIIYIAFAQFIEAFTSVNTEIISTSVMYRYQTFFIFIMIGLVVTLNYILIPIYGIKGAAISTMISLCSINVMKTLFIWIKFSIHPFKKINLTVFLLLTVVYVLSTALNEIIDFSAITQFLVMMVIITTVYWFFVLKLKLSEDINNKVSSILKLFKDRTKI